MQEFDLNVPLIDVREIHIRDVDVVDSMDGIFTAELQRDKALILNDIEEIYENFDSEIKSLSNSRSEILFKLKFMELHYLVVHQELMIIGQFEEPEKLLLETIGVLAMQMKRIEEEIKGFKFKLQEFVGMEQGSQASKSSLDEINMFFRLNGIISIIVTAL